MSEHESVQWTVEQKDEAAATYKEHFPDAIDDPSKAQLMAEASTNQETAAIRARKIALEAASHLGDNVPNEWRSPDNYGPAAAVNTYPKKAEEARRAADDYAQKAADTYDQVKDL